jgi:hypothetical protein
MDAVIVLDEGGAERPAHGAREAAPQGHGGDRTAGLFTIEAPEGGDGGIIESGLHADTHHQLG